MIMFMDCFPKKEEMVQGPSKHLRYLPEEVKSQMISVEFNNVTIYNEMSMHFLIVADK